jgi:membrane protease YdiL (CAAX protease family)
MNNNVLPAVAGTAIAILITTAMDATGYSAFSALPLFPLAGLFWYLQKFSRAEIGLVWGPPYAYGLAIAYPIIVLSLIGLIAFLAGAVDTSEADWNKALLNMALMSSTGVIIGMITEEGFFRGWLWAALKRAGKSDTYVLVWTSLAFTAWHISAISLDTGFDVPAKRDSDLSCQRNIVGPHLGLVAADIRFGHRIGRLPLDLERYRLSTLWFWREGRCARHRTNTHLWARSRCCWRRRQLGGRGGTLLQV